ncbi:cupredoxin domain-containing protein [Natronobiforma cellulositropha]|uniref:cupredoxin domain-containing protein n=1 Tax=Natronobiforma cellulositropha TaxID=1679076 RepID=UPI0021D5E7FE|nr:plastocyanin/azurin family copper-binding protein [Natronobiforma cellulositropha]
MERDAYLTRRRALHIAAATGVSVALAGCGGPAEEDDAADDPAPAEEDDETEEEDETEAEDDETEAEDDEAEAADDADDEWEDVEEIVLDGYTPGWEGVEPAAIEGEENPTLVLYEGREYDVTWENADGEPHNIEIWDENDEVVDDYQTEIIDEQGETQTLTFEASEEMVAYVCEVHIGTMLGDLEIRTEDGE